MTNDDPRFDSGGNRKWAKREKNDGNSIPTPQDERCNGHDLFNSITYKKAHELADRLLSFLQALDVYSKSDHVRGGVFAKSD